MGILDAREACYRIKKVSEISQEFSRSMTHLVLFVSEKEVMKSNIQRQNCKLSDK